MKLRYIKLLAAYYSVPKDYEVFFAQEEDQSGTLKTHAEYCLVGLNGAGKSKLLEFLAEAFAFLYGQNPDVQEPFGFELVYDQVITANNFRHKNEFLGTSRRVTWKKEINPPTAQPFVGGNPVEEGVLPEESGVAAFLKLLPQHVIGYSSGANESLSRHFVMAEDQTAADVSADQPLIFLDNEQHKALYLASQLLPWDTEDRAAILPPENPREAFRLESFRLHFRWPMAADSLFTLSEGLRTALRYLRDAATGVWESSDESELVLDFWVPRQQRLPGLTRYFTHAFHLYTHLYAFYQLNQTVPELNLTEPPEPVFAIEAVTLQRYGAAVNTERVIDYDDLSDGEHQYLQIMGSFALFNRREPLFLWDAPTTHFNPQWRRTLMQRLNQLRPPQDANYTLLLTTHSPMVVSDFRREQVYHLTRESESDRRSPKHPTHETFGASLQTIMALTFGQKQTFADLAYTHLQEEYVRRLETLSSPRDIEALLEKFEQDMGYSLEKTLFRTMAYRKLNRDT